MNKAFKFRIYPNAEQRGLFARTFGSVRFIYNRMLADKIAYYELTNQSLITTPAQYKTEFEWLKDVDSLALANEQLHLEVAYKNFFRDKSIGFPKFKCKHRDKKSYTTNCVNGNIRIESKAVILPKLGKVRMKQHRAIPQGYILKSCTVNQTPAGKYFVSILYEYEQIIQPVKIECIVGLDFSMKELYISSDNEYANYPRYYRRAIEKLQREQRKLSKMEQRSRNYYKQKLIVARLHEKIANQRKDFLHKKSRQIANVYDSVAVEDLNMKAMAQALNFGKSVSDNSWGMFTSFLSYKLVEQGKQLVKISKWFPSSKTCSACGARKEELKLSERVYVCDCGNILDRDVNAAINIKNEGMRILGIA